MREFDRSSGAGRALLGRWPRYEGVLVLGVYAGLMILGAKVLGGPERNHRWPVLLRALAGVSVVLALVSLLESVGLRPLGGAADLRPGATLGNASDQGLVGLMITAVLALPAIRGHRVNWFLSAGCVAAVFTTVLSGSRAALLGLVVASIILVLGVVLGERRIDRRIFATVICTVVGAGLLILLVPGLRERLMTGSTITGRWLLWGQSLKMAADHPWTGVGPSGFVDVFPAYQNQQWAIQTGGDFPPDSPHLWLLQALLAGGIPLLLAALLLGVSVLAAAVHRIRTADNPQRTQLIGSFAAIAGYCAGLLTGFTSPGTTPLAVFLCGGLIATTAQQAPLLTGKLGLAVERLRSGRVRFALGVGAVAAGLAIALPATAAEWPMDAGARLARDGDIAGAEDQFQAAYSLRPWDSDTALLAAQAFAGPASDGNPEAAARALKWAKISLARTPGSIEAGLALSIGYMHTGNLQTAKDHLDTLIARAPYTTALYIQRGVANFGLGEPTQSLTDLQTAASQSPSSPLPWSIMAGIYDRIGDHDKAAAARVQADQISRQ
ncbi:O-antigen ligase family protein [Arthrobacter sp. SRS-W-1-2016]|uniref:O-antigen ligase family protein n=1 Tax=Arthrobacter sp. SRS-W-1-2016 TaxID=1930254 RepID=UPI000990AA1F|nr:O-antigen ligase family protein [Arthrobacter sp. SRS-W-1-2016]